MLAGISPEVVLAAVYALFLALAAAALEKLAQQSHQRSGEFHVSGFRYDEQRDSWACPAGGELHRVESDARRRRTRYRAPAHLCNACCLKVHCTDSPHGREIVREVDSWLSSELRRFHLGLSCALLLLSALIAGLEVSRHHRPRELLVLGASLALVVRSAAPRLRSLRAPHPAAEAAGGGRRGI